MNNITQHPLYRRQLQLIAEAWSLYDHFTDSSLSCLSFRRALRICRNLRARYQRRSANLDVVVAQLEQSARSAAEEAAAVEREAFPSSSQEKVEQIEVKLQPESSHAAPDYVCKFCGQPSYVHPFDQTPPPDYCHESDHGEPDYHEPSPADVGRSPVQSAGTQEGCNPNASDGQGSIHLYVCAFCASPVDYGNEDNGFSVCPDCYESSEIVQA